ncbi:MAG TPA: peptidoglycan-binding protein, partial [Candidatus Paceibacterota bacterium]|nr:peptidoglycan-binding protein [Candidatus Paceibacterota bacterium]
ALSDGSVTLDHATVTIPPAISAPIVTSVASSTGATAGGTIVTITGSGFTGATAVKFGTTAATSFTVNSDTSITATSPAGIGAVDVTVTAPGGTSATGSADQFTYAPCVGAIGSPLLVNVTQNISNDVDSGFHGNWALDDYTRHIQVWLDSGTTYCAQVDYNGTFHAPAGVSSPAAGTPIPAAIVGTMVGGYRASIVGTLLASQTIPTTVDYQGVISTGATPGYVSWPGATFNTGYTFNYLDNGNDWSWTYTTPNGATWINAGSGSTGDIGPVVDTNTGTGYETIQAAVTAAHSGDTINVAAGTYDSFSVANKTGITITGAGTTATLIVPTTLVTTGVAHKYTSNLLASVFVNNSTNVLIQGMTIQSNNQTPGSGGPDAIVFWNASTGSIKDCAVTGTYAINGVQTGQGIAVDAASGTTSLTVNNCAISGFQKNGIEAIDGNGAVSGATDTTTVTVTGGSITGAGPTGAIAQNGIVLWNRGGGTVTGSVNGTTISGFDYTGADTAAGALAYGGGNLTTVHNATLTNNQLNLSTTGSPAIDATQNYWGRAAGPDVTTLDGSITYSPWWADAAMTTLQSSTTPDTNGNQTTSLPSVSTLIGTSTASTNINVTAVIPSGTTVTGNTTWDGVISAPTPPVTTPTVIVSGFNTTVTSAVTVGSTASDLIFDNAVKLTFAGQSGQHVGWYNHAGAFTEITATCAANDQITGDALAAGTSCKIDASPDLVVWTKHFSTFVTYTQTAIPPTPVATTPVVNGSILSFSGGGGGTPNPLPGAIAVNTETVTTTNTTTSVPQGRVLGAAVYNFGQNLTIGSQGADVTALQQYLINGGYSIPAGVTGYFGAETRAAVIAFQKATGIAQVGIVGPLTRADLDKGVIATTPETTPTVEKTNLTTSQVDSILGVLQSFNVDQATMNKVRAALGL